MKFNQNTKNVCAKCNVHREKENPRVFPDLSRIPKVIMELMAGIEPATSSLPRMRSTD